MAVNNIAPLIAQTPTTIVSGKFGNLLKIEEAVNGGQTFPRVTWDFSGDSSDFAQFIVQFNETGHHNDGHVNQWIFAPDAMGISATDGGVHTFLFSNGNIGDGTANGKFFHFVDAGDNVRIDESGNGFFSSILTGAGYSQNEGGANGYYMNKSGGGTQTIIDPDGNLIVATAAPAAANSTGAKGQIAFDATHFYVCIADNSWVRAAFAAW